MIVTSESQTEPSVPACPPVNPPVAEGVRRQTSRAPLHYGWIVAGVTFLVLIVTAGVRATPGVLMVPLEAEFGWSRATTSGAVTANLVVYGITAPFAAALMERFGIRRVVAASLLLVAVGSGLTLVMTSAWQLWLLWGLAVGIGMIPRGEVGLIFAQIGHSLRIGEERIIDDGVYSAVVLMVVVTTVVTPPLLKWAMGRRPHPAEPLAAGPV